MWKSNELWSSTETENVGFELLTAVVMFPLANCIILVSRLPYSSILMNKPICSSETSVNFRWATYHYIPDDIPLHRQTICNIRSGITLQSQYINKIYDHFTLGRNAVGSDNCLHLEGACSLHSQENIAAERSSETSRTIYQATSATHQKRALRSYCTESLRYHIITTWVFRCDCIV
jgi:hypothetical protein